MKDVMFDTSALMFLLLVSPMISVAHRIKRDSSHENNLVENVRRKSTLRQVNLVIRHGERSPQSTYPKDPYIDDPMEPFGWGQLTNAGRLSQYNQGLFLRQRYDQFLGTKYSPEVFWLQSTAADRTKMSALLEAAALWQPDDDQTFLSGLPWQPVTLNYQTKDQDDLLLLWATCPDYARMREAVLKSEEIQIVNQMHKDLYEALKRHTGQSIENPDDVFDLYSTLDAERTMKLPLPQWADEYFPEKMECLSKLSLKMNVYNESLLRMKAGPMISAIANNMVDKSRGNLKPAVRKMFMYVGHDSTISNLLEGMKIWDMQIPSYNIMTMIELHENDNGYSVQVYLKNSTRFEPYPLIIPGCDFACPLSQFLDILRPMIMSQSEWRKDCVLKDENYIPGQQPLP
ncbi:hypothetical protein QAD02_022245 [Eretmocerus hayati]|uniref:Uncharacterized protein n=1 Tax=Eretmocerus hayati TaxID=131215 RepID=A0ACC2PSF6_9HYME|nr:hypothetical protein QAD02_022245 [Eretmocerus hayati]